MRFDRLSKRTMLFWVAAVLTVAYGAARIVDVPSLQARPLIMVALALSIYGATEGYVGPRPRRYALMGTVLFGVLVYAFTGGDVAAVEPALSVVLCTAAMGGYVLSAGAYVTSERARRSSLSA